MYLVPVNSEKSPWMGDYTPGRYLITGAERGHRTHMIGLRPIFPVRIIRDAPSDFGPFGHTKGV